MYLACKHSGQLQGKGSTSFFSYVKTLSIGSASGLACSRLFHRLLVVLVADTVEWFEKESGGTKVAGSKGGAVVRALASHQCGIESWRRRHMWVEFVVGSLPCSERFFSGYSGFPLSLKTNTFKFQFDLERTDTFQRVLMNSLVLRG